MATIISSKTSGVGGLSVTGDASGVLQLASADGTPAVTINASQNVGIGTSSPAGKLHVSGGRSFFAASSEPFAVGAGYSSAGGAVYFGATDATATPGVQISGATGSPLLNIDSSGNVGIGTASPQGKLDVQGNINLAFPCSVGAILSSQTFTLSGATAPTYGLGINHYTGGTEGSVSLSGYYGVLLATANVERMRITSAGALILAGSTAQKATGTSWSNPSDIRLKDNITEYAKGLDELMQVSVKEWEYNGKGGTTEGLKGLGVIADEVMLILPNTVENYKAKLNSDDEEDSDIKKFDATEITWLMLKSIQELKVIIDTQNARITTLEGVSQ